MVHNDPQWMIFGPTDVQSRSVGAA